MAGLTAPVTNSSIDNEKNTNETIQQESKDLHQAVTTALKNEGGAPVHTFNPDASAEEKKAKVMKTTTTLTKPDEIQKPSLTTDIGSADTKKVAEAVSTTIHDKDAVKKTPGSFVDSGMPDWYKIGWTAFSNLPNPGDEKAMAEFLKTHTQEQVKEAFFNSRSSNGDIDDLLAQFISDKYYGEWYHNCGVVFVAIFFTWLLIKLRLGLMSCFIVGAFFGKLCYTKARGKRERFNL